MGRGTGHRYAHTLCSLLKLQGVQVQGLLHQLQGEHGVGGDPQQAAVGHGEDEMDCLLHLLSLAQVADR